MARFFPYVPALALSLGLALSHPANAQNYSVLDLGTLGGVGSYSTARGINDRGQVVGDSGLIGHTVTHGFITGPNGAGLFDLGTLGGTFSLATGINVNGQTVGISTLPGDTAHRAFITGPNGVGMTALGAPGAVNSYAYGINAAGQAVGHVTLRTGDPFFSLVDRAFITGPNGVGMTDLGTLGGPNSRAYGVNASGQVVGDSSLQGDDPDHAFITGPNGVGMTDLGTLGGAESHGAGINSSGQVVGFSSLPGDTANHAFVTGPNGIGMTDLGTLGGEDSFAAAINIVGQVVGLSEVAGEIGYHAFITGADGRGLTDLNRLVSLTDGSILTAAAAINDFGQIVANGSNGHAYLLSPIASHAPEPGISAAMLTGLGLIGFNARRRKSRAMAGP